MGRSRRIAKNALLAFVLVSVGFALGKHSVRHSPAPSLPGEADAEAVGAAGRAAETARVYYLHATFRCVTCNTIEKMTRDVLDQQFADELAAGQVEWRKADFQENESLARQFDVLANCVVVARMQGETVLEYRRLDQVWTLLDDAPRFRAYVGDAIRTYLAGAGEGDDTP